MSIKLDLEYLAQTGAHSSTVTIALIAYVRKLEAALLEACSHLVMAVKLDSDEGLMDREEANEELRWVKAQRALVENGAVLQ